MAGKSHRDSAVRFVTAKRGSERATEIRQYVLLRPNVALGNTIYYCQKEPPRLSSTICYGQTWARTSHQDSVVRFDTAKYGSERATETRQNNLSRPNVGQKEPPRLCSTICYGQTWARKSHRDSAVRFVTAELARQSHRDSAVRFVTAKSWLEKATETQHYDSLQPNVGQKEPLRLGSTIFSGQTWARKSRTSTICYGQAWDRKSHRDSEVRFDTAKRGPERATETRQYDLLRPNVRQKEPHRDSEVRFVPAKCGPERATKIRQYDLIRPNMGQKEPPRLGSTICYGQTWARKSHRDSAVRFVTAKHGPERATKTRQYDLLRPNMGQKEPPRLGSTICYGQTWPRKSHRDSAVRFVTAKHRPERATETLQYDLLRPNVGQKKPPRLCSTICYGETWARKSHRDSAVRFVTAELARKSHRDSAVRFGTAKSWPERATKIRQYDFVTAKRAPERATKTRQYDLLRPNLGQKEPPRLGSTICYGQTWARKSNRDSAIRFVTAKHGPERASAVRFVMAKSWPERATETRQYDLLRPNMGQKEPPRQRSMICYGQMWTRKSHRDSAVRFVTANVRQNKPLRLGSTICYGQKLARNSHQDSAVRFVTAKCGPRHCSTICYGQTWARKQKEPPSLGSTICYGQELARKSHRDSAVRFVTAKHGPERATETWQYDLLRPNVGQKEPPRLGSTICFGQELARQSH